MEADPRFAEGVELFNKGDYYAAHDAWESLWLERFGEEKDFLQGLILSAVALHHWGRGNLRGARSRWRLALSYLVFHVVRRFPAWAGWLPAHHPRLAPARAFVAPDGTLPTTVQAVSGSDGSPPEPPR